MERAKKNNDQIEEINITASSFREEELGIEQSRCAEVICMSNKTFSLPSGPQIDSI